MRVSIEFESFASVGVCFFQTEYLYIVCVSLLFQLCIFSFLVWVSFSKVSDASFYWIWECFQCGCVFLSNWVSFYRLSMCTIAIWVSFQFSFEYLSERLSMLVFLEFQSVSSVGVCFFQTEYLSIVWVCLLLQFEYLFNSRLSIFL